METNLVERESVVTAGSIHEDPRVHGAKSDLASLEKSYKKSSRILQSLVVGLVFAVMVVLAYSLFGGRVDREAFTTDVTPVHVELSPISDHRQTAQNLRNMQM